MKELINKYLTALQCFKEYGNIEYKEIANEHLKNITNLVQENIEISTYTNLNKTYKINTYDSEFNKFTLTINSWYNISTLKRIFNLTFLDLKISSVRTIKC